MKISFSTYSPKTFTARSNNEKRTSNYEAAEILCGNLELSQIESLQKKMSKFPDKNNWTFEELMELYETSEEYIDFSRKHFDERDDRAYRFTRCYKRAFKDSDEAIKTLPESEFKRDLTAVRRHINNNYFTCNTGGNAKLLSHIAMQNSSIDDLTVKRVIKNKLEAFKHCRFTPYNKIYYYGQKEIKNTELEEIMLLQDAVNESKGIYNCLYRGASFPVRDYDFQESIDKKAAIHSKENHSKEEDERKILLKKIAENKSFYAREMQNMINTTALEQYLKKFSGSNPKMCEYLYDKYYLNKYPDNVKEVCHKIADEFKSFVLLPINYEKVDLNFIYSEFSKWKKAGKEQAIFPDILKICHLKQEYLDSKRVGQASVGYISIKNYQNLKYSLRHEMMHLNDVYKGIYSIDKLGLEYNDKEMFKEKKLYREELEKTEASDFHVDYAYTNRAEFVAVAAELDASKYSQEFKEVLVKFGMPEWVLNLDNQTLF